MDTLYLSSTVNHGADRRLTATFKKPSTLFSKTKHSDDWHQQIDFTAGILRPSEDKFPYQLLRKHTDAYLKKKGKITQVDADIRLAILIENHEARDVAIAACAHAMSPMSVRALLHVELNVAPATFYGLDLYLQCLIAANSCNPKSVSVLEAAWAHQLLPYAKTHGAGAAGRYLEGLCKILRESKMTDMRSLPDFVLLARRAFKDFATQLEGLKLKCQWVTAHAAVNWLMDLARTPSIVMPPGHLVPEHLLNEHLPIWRIWANWRPNLDRITLLNGLDSRKRAILPDLLALEGPDFIAGTHATLRDGLVAQYAATKPLARFRGLIIEVEKRTKEDLKDLLNRIATVLNSTLKSGEAAFEAFIELIIARPITKEALRLLEAFSKLSNTPKSRIHSAVLEVYLARSNIGGRHILVLQEVICALGDDRGEDLREVLLRPWLIEGLEKCMRECRTAVRTHIENKLPWAHLAMEFHHFCATLKGSKNVLLLLNDEIQKQLDVLPSVEQLRNVIDIYKAAGGKHRGNETPKDVPTREKDSSDKLKGSSSRVSVPSYLLGEVPCNSKDRVLQDVVEAYCIDRLMERGTISHASQKTVNAILEVWENTTNTDTDRRDLAIIATKHVGPDFVLRCRCLSQIAGNTLSPDFVKTLLEILKRESTEPEQVRIDFIKLLANIDNMEAVDCWKDMLYGMIQIDNHPGIFKPWSLIDYSIQKMTAFVWSQFMLDLNAIFPEVISNTKASPPPILQLHLHLWVQQLSSYIPTITRLEEALGKESNAVRIILRGGDGLWVENLVRILVALDKAREQAEEKLMQNIVGRLAEASKEKKSCEIAQCLEALLDITPECLGACERIWDAKYGIMPYASYMGESQGRKASIKGNASTRENCPPSSTANTVAEVILAGWLQDPLMVAFDKVALKSLAALLNLEIYQYDVPLDKMAEATAYFDRLEAEIVNEAERLEGIQKALKAEDPIGTASLLQQLGIADTSPLDEEIESLPAGVIDAVEKHGENEVEISFPLPFSTDLQRNAMGLPAAAKTLLVRLILDYTGNLPPSLCIHLDNQPTSQDSTAIIDHSPWICFKDSAAPVKAFCHGKTTLFTWQLSRSIHRYLKLKNLGIADFHAFIKTNLEEMAHLCISCGENHKAGKYVVLRRASPCQLTACVRLWNNLPLELRIPELRTDIFAVDMLLTTVYTAAMSARTELLPGCPISGTAAVSGILNTLPQLSVLRDAVNVSSVLKSYHKDAEKLLVWACTHFRGFITTATGICKIPSFPVGTHQFVLANASPKLEADYASTMSFNGSPSTRVLFHGTSLDRLPAILAQGLRVCSGTALQRTGAAHGKGIYMAEEPSTSFGYSPSAVSWRNSGLNNMRLLLGCEVAGYGGRSVSNGIHVISDEKSVMLRYIFLLSNGAYVPIANHVVPALGSAMSALRSGAV